MRSFKTQRRREAQERFGGEMECIEKDRKASRVLHRVVQRSPALPGGEGEGIKAEQASPFTDISPKWGRGVAKEEVKLGSLSPPRP